MSENKVDGENIHSGKNEDIDHGQNLSSVYTPAESKNSFGGSSSINQQESKLRTTVKAIGAFNQSKNDQTLLSDRNSDDDGSDDDQMHHIGYDEDQIVQLEGFAQDTGFNFIGQGTNEVDQAQDRQIKQIMNQLSIANQHIGSHAHRLEQVEAQIKTIKALSKAVNKLRTNEQSMQVNVGLAARKIRVIEEQVGIDDNDDLLQATQMEDALVELINQYNEQQDSLKTADLDRKKDITEQVQLLDGQINEAAREYLALRQAMKLSVADDSLPIRKIRDLQDQLIEVSRSKLTTKPVHASRWAAVTSMFTTDKEAAAFRSAQRVAQNPAFSKLEQRNDNELKVNGEIIALMTKAAYALNTFHAFNTVEATNTTPQTDISLSPLRTSGPKQNNVDEEQVTKQNLINKAVLHVVQLDLQAALQWEKGLIGTQNKSLQFWGKVVMALALAVAINVAAIGIALALGYTAPAFMASYIAAVQANAIVTTVLNFVASKLALDLSSAAALTVVAAAGTLGMFGKALHMAGAPTSLKKDLDKAVTDMDAAINNTPAMRP